MIRWVTGWIIIIVWPECLLYLFLIRALVFRSVWNYFFTFLSMIPLISLTLISSRFRCKNSAIAILIRFDLLTLPKAFDRWSNFWYWFSVKETLICLKLFFFVMFHLVWMNQSSSMKLSVAGIFKGNAIKILTILKEISGIKNKMKNWYYWEWVIVNHIGVYNCVNMIFFNCPGINT